MHGLVGFREGFFMRFGSITGSSAVYKNKCSLLTICEEGPTPKLVKSDIPLLKKVDSSSVAFWPSALVFVGRARRNRGVLARLNWLKQKWSISSSPFDSLAADAKFVCSLQPRHALAVINSFSAKRASRDQLLALGPYSGQGALYRLTRQFLFVLDAGQVFKYCLASGRPRLWSRVRTDCARRILEGDSVRLLTPQARSALGTPWHSAFRVCTPKPVEQVFLRNLAFWERARAAAEVPRADLEIGFAWNQAKQFRLSSVHFDSGSRTLYALLDFLTPKAPGPSVQGGLCLLVKHGAAEVECPVMVKKNCRFVKLQSKLLSYRYSLLLALDLPSSRLRYQVVKSEFGLRILGVKGGSLLCRFRVHCRESALERSHPDCLFAESTRSDRKSKTHSFEGTLLLATRLQGLPAALNVVCQSTAPSESE